MASKPPISVGDIAYAERLAQVIGAAFARDALNRAVMLTTDGSPNDAQITVERRADFLLPSIRSKAAHGALLVEAGDWAAVALWGGTGLARAVSATGEGVKPPCILYVLAPWRCVSQEPEQS
ncbi:hypothetical protein E8E14_012028 [Neopestalotiopsis sp. 37M]|nr:hypothetical protein E8E14_012028 [Neopestalotiopsis sp. 37M]